MKINLAGLAFCAILAGCGGEAPFGEDATNGGPDTGDGIESDRTIPPGTTSPQSSDTIFRREPQDGETGNGFARGVRYNSEDDTFFVDNLPFDGGADTPYIRGSAVGSLGDYAVYEAVEQYPDTITGEPINQFTHRAIYGVSRTGNTEFAIVRTGAYVQYGFGGFVYQRNGDVDLPTTGQGIYVGQGAGLRDFNQRGRLEYTTSDVEFNIDFDDFNEDTGRFEGAVRGEVNNRRVFDINGVEITDDVIARVGEANNATLSRIPGVRFVIAPNALDQNGEFTGGVFSQFTNDSGEPVVYEEGQYYGILAGENANELVGVIVTETTLDPISGEGVRETNGFTIYRENRE